jgi:hypothetical protein
MNSHGKDCLAPGRLKLANPSQCKENKTMRPAFKKNIFYGLAAGLCLSVWVWISILIPPIQSPDEYQHLYRAYLLSNNHWLLQANEPGQRQQAPWHFVQRGGDIDSGLIAFKDAHWPLVLDPHRQLSKMEQDAVSRIEWQHTSQFEKMPGAGYYFPLVYGPQALGLLTGRWLGLSVHQSYWFCRAYTSIACVLLLVAAIRMWRPPPLAWALLLLPMTVFQWLSPTIDGLTTSMAVLTLSLFVRICVSQTRPPPPLLMGMVIAIFLLTTTRTHLLPMLALPYFLAWRYRSWRVFLGALFLSLTVLAWLVFAITSTQDDRVQHAVSSGAALWHYISHPQKFLGMVWTSLSHPATFDFYTRSFIGILGWLNVVLPEKAYTIIWTGLGLCSLWTFNRFGPKTGWSSSCRWLLAFLALSATGLVFLAMLTTWTPADSPRIEGVQGRYFIVPAIMLAYASMGSGPSNTRFSHSVTRILLGIYGMACMGALLLALLARYD